MPGRLSLPALPSPPGALSAAQLRAIAQTVRAQRQSLAAMQAQPARLEEAVGDFVRPGPAEDGPRT